MIEKYALEKQIGRLVAESFNVPSTFDHVGNQPDSVDGYLVHNGLRVAAVEITCVVDQPRQKFDSSLNSDCVNRRLEIPQGAGAWIAYLNFETRCNQQRGEIYIPLINRLNELGLDHLSRYSFENGVQLLSLLRATGATKIRRIPSMEGFVYLSNKIFLEDPRIDPSTNVVARDVQKWLHSHLEKVYRFITRSDSLTSVLVLVVGTGFSSSSFFRMRQLSSSQNLPSVALDLPEGLDEIWVIETTESTVLRYQRSLGWSIVSTRQAKSTTATSVPLVRVLESNEQ